MGYVSTRNIEAALTTARYHELVTTFVYKTDADVLSRGSALSNPPQVFIQAASFCFPNCVLVQGSREREINGIQHGAFSDTVTAREHYKPTRKSKARLVLKAPEACQFNES